MGFFPPDPGLHRGELADSGPFPRRIESLCRQTVDAPHPSLPDARNLRGVLLAALPAVLAVPEATRARVPLVRGRHVVVVRVPQPRGRVVRVPQPRGQVVRVRPLARRPIVSRMAPATTAVGAAVLGVLADRMVRVEGRPALVEIPEGMVVPAATLVRMPGSLVLSELPVEIVPVAIVLVEIVRAMAVPTAPVLAVRVLALPAAAARVRTVGIGPSVRVVSSRIAARVRIVGIGRVVVRADGPVVVLARGATVAMIGWHLVG